MIFISRVFNICLFLISTLCSIYYYSCACIVSTIHLVVIDLYIILMLCGHKIIVITKMYIDFSRFRHTMNILVKYWFFNFRYVVLQFARKLKNICQPTHMINPRPSYPCQKNIYLSMAGPIQHLIGYIKIYYQDGPIKSITCHMLLQSYVYT